MSVRFYIGCHQPADAQFFSHCCINFSRLQNRKYRRGFSPHKWILDAGTFAGLIPNLEEYADAAHRWSWCGILEAVVAPDLLCLPQHLSRTGLSVYQHQVQTIINYDTLKKLVKNRLYVMPVLQGSNTEEYKQHLCDYGNRLSFGAWVGVGSLSGRKTNTIAGILQTIHCLRPDLKLHGFGCGKRVLKHWQSRRYLWSADSSAWSKAAQLEKLRRGCSSNRPAEASAYSLDINSFKPSTQTELFLLSEISP